MKKLKCYVLFKGHNYYTHDGLAGRVDFDRLPEKTYFCMGNVGNQPQAERGKAMLFCWDDGTCLAPIFNAVDDSPVIMPGYAGKEIRDGQLIDA